MLLSEDSTSILNEETTSYRGGFFVPSFLPPWRVRDGESCRAMHGHVARTAIATVIAIDTAGRSAVDRSVVTAVMACGRTA